jgi:uncharacterized protein YndB with AHSA1/START domain
MTDETEIEITRLLPAPASEVFRWWTEADLLRRWMSPVGSVEAEVDLRVGGTFRILMKDGDVAIDHVGEYLEIDRPRRLVFTWRSQYAGPSSVVTVSFQSEGSSSTRLVIVHSGLPPGAAEEHQGGWGAIARRLANEMVAA